MVAIIRTRIKTQEVEVLEDVLCNKCGSSCKSTYGSMYGLIEAVVTSGDESTHLGDMRVREWKFSLCEECLWPLLESFKHDALVVEFEPEEQENK